MSDEQILALPYEEAISLLMSEEQISRVDAESLLETMGGGDDLDGDLAPSTPQDPG